MLRYSILFSDNEFVYVELIEDTYNKTRVKINISDFDQWKKDKVEF